MDAMLVWMQELVSLLNLRLPPEFDRIAEDYQVPCLRAWLAYAVGRLVGTGRINEVAGARAMAWVATTSDASIRDAWKGMKNGTETEATVHPAARLQPGHAGDLPFA